MQCSRHPGDWLKLYVYGDLNRVRSSRLLEREAQRNVEVMWLLKKLRPDHKTLADFRAQQRDAIQKVCRELTTLCKALDLFGGELVAIEGTYTFRIDATVGDATTVTRRCCVTTYQ